MRSVRSVRSAAGVVFAVMAGLPSAAAAHGALPTIFEIAEFDGEIIGLGATFGLMLRDADGTFRWTCEDVVGTPVSGYVVRSPTDVIAVTRTGVWRTQDAGCSYQQVDSAIAERPIAEVRTIDGESYAVTAHLTEPNAVFRSIDFGLRWAQFGPEIDDNALFGLAVDEGRVVVTGLSAEDGWTVFEWGQTPEVIASLPEGTLDAEPWITNGAVWVADIVANESVLYEIVDGSPVVRQERLDGVVTDVEAIDGTTYVALDTNEIFEVTADGLVLVPDEVGTCFARLGDGGIARCGALGGDYAVLMGPPGAMVPYLPYPSVEANACMLEQDHLCADLWGFVELHWEDDGPTEDPVAKSRGCATAEPVHVGWLAPMAIAAMRRRRR